MKSLKPRKVGEAAYGPPTDIKAVTGTAVLTSAQPQWIYAYRFKKAPSVDVMNKFDIIVCFILCLALHIVSGNH